MFFCSGRCGHIMFDVMSSLDHWKQANHHQPANTPAVLSLGSIYFVVRVQIEGRQDFES